MPTIGNTLPTLLDVARRSDPSGRIATIVELLNQTNEILDDMGWQEGNLPTGHKTTVRTGFPAVTWRKLNYGVQPSKSTTTPVTDSTGMLEAYAEVDKALAQLNGNTPEFRLSEDRAFLESMNIEMAKTLFYGDTAVNPERFVGLAPRYATSSTTTTLSGYNIIKGGGSGSTNTSIWLVVWGPNTAYGIYPKGSQAGFQHQDLGEVTLYDAANGRFQGYRSHYKWDCGVTIRDWRYVCRIANIDVTALTSNAATGADVVDLMTQALEKVPNINFGNAVFYVNRTISSFLRRQMNAKASYQLNVEDLGGKKVMTFAGVPVRRVEQLLNTESTVA